MPADARAVSCETALCEGGEGKGVSQAVVREQHASKTATSSRRRRLSRDMPFASPWRQSAYSAVGDDLHPAPGSVSGAAGASRSLAFRLLEGPDLRWNMPCQRAFAANHSRSSLVFDFLAFLA